MKIVLDTNVLVSGLLQPKGKPARLLELLSEGKVVCCVDPRLLLEYEDVLRRPEFPFDPDDIDALIEYMRRYGFFPDVVPLSISIPDPDDLPFLEVAVAGQAEALVTGNTRHFPRAVALGVPVMAPSRFLEYYARNVRKPTPNGENARET